MKKGTSITIILVLAVLGVVVYLLRDRLKTFLGARVPGEEPEEALRPTGVFERLGETLGISPPSFFLGEKLLEGKPPPQLGERAYQLAGGVIQPDVVQLVTELYPKPLIHLVILARLVGYIKGQASGIAPVIHPSLWYSTRHIPTTWR